MPSQDVVEQLPVDLCLRHDLFDTRQIFVPSNARSNGNNVFRTENFRRHAFVFDQVRIVNRFFSQPGGNEELNRKVFDEQVLALDSPASGLQVRIDRRNSRAQGLIAGDENNIGVVGREWLAVIDRGQSSTQRVVLD